MEEEEIERIVERHEKYRLGGINLIPSENFIMPRARNLLSSDLAGRYESEWYGGSRYAREICERTVALAKKLFEAKHAIVTPLSGNICDLAVIFSFTKSGDTVAGVPKEHGGYPFGYEKFERKFYPLPMKDYVVNAEEVKNMEKDFPLILLASSIIPFPHPVRSIRDAMRGWMAYDASHVLGLIAGGKFQQPLEEGADVMIGSTHKTFPGPQGGIVVTNSDEVAERMEKYLLFDYDEGIGLVDNPHVNRIAALGAALEEMIRNGREYASRVIRNAKHLARNLHEGGLRVRFEERDFTESHQILLDMEKEEAGRLYRKLEENGIFIDCIGRIGVAEVSHIGMKEEEMEKIAHLILDVMKGKDVREEAKKLAMEFYSTF
ncbi:MAG: hypothetical protein J7L31_00350 [Thermoplasmata archaeon]|nr:hypothetical protein [Thermoplasmata archaeon]